MAEVRVTQAGAYAELGGSGILVTQSGAYAEFVVVVVTPGAGIIAASNVTVDYDSNSLEEYLNAMSLEAIANTIETTVFTDTANTYMPGLVQWSVPVSGLWDMVLDRYLRNDAVTVPATLRTLAIGIDTVTYTWTTSAYITDYNVIVGAPNKAITWSGKLVCSGPPTMS